MFDKTFNPDMPLIARKRFTAHARKFVPGDPFDWRDMGLGRRKVRHLFESGHVVHPDDAVSQPAEPVPPASAEPLSPAWGSISPGDSLEQIDDLNELRAIAEAEGAPTKRSKADQRDAIREHRSLNDGQS